jgi:hypothetical protein
MRCAWAASLLPIARYDSLRRHTYMERSQVLDAMGQLKLYGMKAAYDEIIATAVKRQHEPQQIIRRPAHRRDQREAGTLDQVPDDHRQVAPGQGDRRVRLRRDAGQRDAGARSGRRSLPRASAQRRADRRHRNRKVASRRRDRPPASATAPAAGSSTSSTWSTSSTPKPAPTGRAAPPISSAASTS